VTLATQAYDATEGYEAQNMQDAKEKFLARARSGSAEDYLNSTRTKPVSAYEIKAGWDIPAVLEQALNSDLPGEMKALVRENVYDTATGRFLLIPQGARLVGAYDSRVAYGQNGIQVAWSRLIFPYASCEPLFPLPNVWGGAQLSAASRPWGWCSGKTCTPF
jgi:type IV secretion system protein VirB10